MSMKALLIAAIAIGAAMYSDLNAQRGNKGSRDGGATARPGGNPSGNPGGNPRSNPDGNFRKKRKAGLGNGLNQDW